MLFGKLGFWELALILLIALVIFGPSKLPEMGKALGRSLREFRRATKEMADDINKVDADLKAEDDKASPRTS